MVKRTLKQVFLMKTGTKLHTHTHTHTIDAGTLDKVTSGIEISLV